MTRTQEVIFSHKVDIVSKLPLYSRLFPSGLPRKTEINFLFTVIFWISCNNCVSSLINFQFDTRIGIAKIEPKICGLGLRGRKHVEGTETQKLESWWFLLFLGNTFRKTVTSDGLEGRTQSNMACEFRNLLQKLRMLVYIGCILRFLGKS